MKFLVLMIMLTSVLSVQAARVRKKCSVARSMSPKCYHKRDEAIFKVALLSYGSNLQANDLDRIEKILVERFSKATNKLVEVEVVVKKVMPLKQDLPSDYTFNNITDPERLHRIWYYDNLNAKVMTEVYEEYKEIETEDNLHKLDAILAITGAQFNGLGFANGRVSITESPREIAWGASDGGRTYYPTDYEIVDELIHELGHNMFLGHASSQCQKITMPADQRKICNNPDIDETTRQECRELDSYYLREQRKCCEISPAKNDVMSYCRGRAIVDEDKMYGFESCNLGMIEELVVPAMLKGRAWNVSGRKSCK